MVVEMVALTLFFFWKDCLFPPDFVFSMLPRDRDLEVSQLSTRK